MSAKVGSVHGCRVYTITMATVHDVTGTASQSAGSVDRARRWFVRSASLGSAGADIRSNSGVRASKENCV